MRICRISKNFPPLVGGLEFHVRDLSVEQGRSGHNVDVFIMRGNEALGAKNVRVRKVGAGSLAPILKKDSLTSFVFMLLCFPTVLRAHRRRRFNIIHLHGDIVEAFFGRLLGRLLGIPQVITIHAGLNRKRTYRILARSVYRFITSIIAVSPDIKKDLISLGIDSKKVTVIHSGINYKLFAEPVDDGYRQRLRQQLSLSADDILMVTVGRLHRMKGLEFLIEAVGKELANTPLKLFIIGDGPERERLKKQAAPYSSRISFMGMVSKLRVVDYLKLSDIFILPSVSLGRQREGTPTAVMEAMAAGLPIVTTDVGGAKLLVESNINGLVVKQNDVISLAEAIGTLSKAISLRCKMGNTNKKRAQRFDWSCVAGKIEKVYSGAFC